MFTLSSIAIISSLTSKKAHVFSLVVIVMSLVVPKIPQAFPLVSLLEFSSVRKKEKELEPQFHCLHVRGISLSTGIIFEILIVRMCKNEFLRCYKNFKMI